MWTPPNPKPTKRPHHLQTVLLRRNRVVLARFHDGYFYSGTIQDLRQPLEILVAWDDGDEPSWLSPDQVALFQRQPLPNELLSGMKIIALWDGDVVVAVRDNTSNPDGVGKVQEGDEVEAQEEDVETDVNVEKGVWFGARVLGPGRKSGKWRIAWEGSEEEAEMPIHHLRNFVESITAPVTISLGKPKVLKKVDSTPEAEAAAEEESTGFAVDLLRRSGRDISKCPSNTRLLREAMVELRRYWRPSIESVVVDTDANGVRGLHVCNDFLDKDEVEALRTVIGAHRAWAQYTYGTTGRRGELASVVQRIDFGPNDVVAEGFVGGSPMLALDAIHTEILELLGTRLRDVFGRASLWDGTAPNSLQLTRMGCKQNIANHWDRRDKWREGIATVAWSELPSEEDIRGESYVLVMQKGPLKALTSVELKMSPGSAYALMGQAQGCTKSCTKHLVGHGRCTCCWTHGIRLDGEITRHSVTLRSFAELGDFELSEGDDDYASS